MRGRGNGSGCCGPGCKSRGGRGFTIIIGSFWRRGRLGVLFGLGPWVLCNICVGIVWIIDSNKLDKIYGVKGCSLESSPKWIKYRRINMESTTFFCSTFCIATRT